MTWWPSASGSRTSRFVNQREGDKLLFFTGYDNDATSLLGELSDERVNVRPGPNVDAFGWFIQQNQIRTLLNDACKQHFLLITARQRLDWPFKATSGANPREGCASRFLASGRGDRCTERVGPEISWASAIFLATPVVQATCRRAYLR
ncbi:hypothetical protein LMG28138_04160 [Pararobbsia alpina]|uniref:Uncharacterized protein n=1 Tax=Pararobbsia alpina TaxID=621374 RepID=A0A6S7BFJ6_9BURK|nr:hypothetical protein LMG28138_04160 [Pararobbsia alpina]